MGLIRKLKRMHKSKKITILLHILAWLVLFSLPYLLTYGQEQEINRIIAHFWIPIGFYVVIFYTNYFLLIDKLLFTKKMALFILINLVIIASFIALKEFIENSFFQELIRNKLSNNGPPLKMFVYVQMLTYLVPLFFAIAIKTTKRWTKTEAERNEAANVKLQSDLQLLSYQLQPHFFFNSLNNIYSLVDISPEKAKSTIHSLSKLMRYLLYETNTDLIPLTKEIDFMKKYIQLMQLRVSEKTKIESNFPTNSQQIQIAPLMFISLIENAFKHGVSAQQESVISIDMTCKNNVVKFVISNGNFPKKSNDKSGSGIGLKNLEQRLELLYPNKYTYISSIENDRFSATLEIET